VLVQTIHPQRCRHTVELFLHDDAGLSMKDNGLQKRPREVRAQSRSEEQRGCRVSPSGFKSARNSCNARTE